MRSCLVFADNPVPTPTSHGTMARSVFKRMKNNTRHNMAVTDSLRIRSGCINSGDSKVVLCRETARTGMAPHLNPPPLTGDPSPAPFSWQRRPCWLSLAGWHVPCSVDRWTKRSTWSSFMLHVHAVSIDRLFRRENPHEYRRWQISASAFLRCSVLPGSAFL